MDWIHNSLKTVNNFITEIPGIVPILINLILGLALLLFGYKLFRLWLLVFGAQSGYSVGKWIVEQVQMKDLPATVVVVLFTLAFAILFWVALRFSFAIAGFMLGLYLAYHYSDKFFGKGNPYIILAAGILIGVLAYFFIKYFIIAATSIYGAFILIDAVSALITNTKALDYIGNKVSLQAALPLVLNILTLIVIALGILFQYSKSQKGHLIKAG